MDPQSTIIIDLKQSITVTCNPNTVWEFYKMAWSLVPPHARANTSPANHPKTAVDVEYLLAKWMNSLYRLEVIPNHEIKIVQQVPQLIREIYHANGSTIGRNKSSLVARW